MDYNNESKTEKREKLEPVQSIMESHKPREDNKESIENINNNTESDKLSAAEQQELINQCVREVKYSLDNKKPWLEKYYKNLKLYNNQRRDTKKVGDPLIFTIHQTIVASLYTDSLQIIFKGRDEGDVDFAANLDSLSKFDYEEMGKDELDYFWTWDTAFFGRGLVEFTHFERDSLTPMPEIIDPLSFIQDPKAKSISGYTKLGTGAARFGGQEIELTKWDIMHNKAYFNTGDLKLNDNRTYDDQNIDNLLQDAQQARDEAQRGDNNGKQDNEDIGDNSYFKVLKWYTIFKGMRCVAYLANNKSKIIRYHQLKDENGNSLRSIPIIDRTLYPVSHSWYATSIPDILEDKQRTRAIIQNALVDAVKADTYTRYVYNKDLIKNRAELDYGFNKHIGVNGNPTNAIVPTQKANVNAVLADYILNTIDAAAQKATATPEITQGVQPETQRTLGETELIANKSATRYSLAAKVFGWSEKRFWQHWYFMYKNYLQDQIDEKLIRINGAYGDEFRRFTKDQIILSVDPDVKVASRNVSEAEKIREQIRFEKLLTIVFQDQTTNRRYGYKKLAELYNMKPTEIRRLLPETIDELIAKDENKLIDANQLPEITKNQNHAVHIEIHTMAAETPAKQAHMAAHKKAMQMMRENPELFSDADPMVMQQAGVTMQAQEQPQQGITPQAAPQPNMPEQGLV